jgi:hypothetical protein
MKNTTNDFSVVLPAGTYFIGDPCYVLGEWDKVIDDTNCFYEQEIHKLHNMNYVGFHTAHGDGEYEGSDGKRYPVDAGLIGAVDIELVRQQGVINLDNLQFEEEKFGSIITFNSPTECGVRSGMIYFGNMTIHTDIVDNSDYDDYWDDDMC